LATPLTPRSITTPPTRKRQKKADSRVAELERKIDALTATLHAQKAGTPEVRHHGAVPQHEGAISHDWGGAAASGFNDLPPGYGPAQTFQREPEREPEAKRRKLDDRDASAVSAARTHHETRLY
jgi:hypothetical protein